MVKKSKMSAASSDLFGFGSRTSETAFNFALSNVLRSMHPKWGKRNSLIAESSSVFEKSSARPDIFVSHSGGVPVTIETEYMPSSSVEKEAKDRLGEKPISDTFPIEHSIAVRVPERLKSVSQEKLEHEIKVSIFEFCMFSSSQSQSESIRWPQIGWIQGAVHELADMIEFATLSENIVSRGMSIVEIEIERTANQLRKECVSKTDTLEKIASVLHQKDCMQTTRMAMSILVNAITLHNSISGANGIKELDEIWKYTWYCW